jgi:hypothetical protein
MALPKEEEDALRQCLRILAPHYSAEKRRGMVEGIEGFIRRGKWPAWDLKDLARLFYPHDQKQEAHMESLMVTAMAAKELSGIGDSFRASDLSAWADCPRVPKDSPLRFWLPECMHEGNPAPAVIPADLSRNKERRNILDPAIDKAINLAKNTNVADVYLQLKELAIQQEKPFTGFIDGEALCYTNDNDQPAKLTKNALRKRLKNRES